MSEYIGRFAPSPSGRLHFRSLVAALGSYAVAKIKNGKTVEVLDHEDGWYHITYEGYEGYAKEEFIKLLSDTVGKEIYSNGITVYLREQMAINSRIVGMINAQQAMKVEQISSEWALVSSGNVKGYVQTQDLDQLDMGFALRLQRRRQGVPEPRGSRSRLWQAYRVRCQCIPERQA